MCAGGAEGAGGGGWSRPHCLATCAVCEGKVCAFVDRARELLAGSVWLVSPVSWRPTDHRVCGVGSWWRRQRCRCIHRISGMPLLVCTGCFVCAQACMRVSGWVRCETRWPVCVCLCVVWAASVLSPAARQQQCRRVSRACGRCVLGRRIELSLRPGPLRNCGLFGHTAAC